ncbi:MULTISPECIES: bifunctional transcriptional activator/DNA repair enzyme AdaA [unclassified Cobetia]|uniref:bifunctional transcriptional activator/DNA repair enzyme AdaA n=1 Tax=unclassified Cobetia TaxID=2609414 RepID=UPI002097B744|nr:MULTISPECIES: methylated-DNA--[protein]-cysteine S-methyltransferase [unclassified Cobetia]MCO7233290.1 methylated-DNA--[protein]-cysteine S-methyltransferase [Cobetia sp. Dlab-2-AX]MCO7236646.1 methylated-DNA--[protein]-cysteine S-methyltransferase [Cobetia sp. Dlab-2-U]
MTSVSGEKTAAGMTAPPAAGDAQGCDEAIWQRLLARQPISGEALRYGVITTGIFCRIGCPSPAPRRDNLRLFADCHAARAAGMRACRRCHPEQPDKPDRPQADKQTRHPVRATPGAPMMPESNAPLSRASTAARSTPEDAASTPATPWPLTVCRQLEQAVAAGEPTPPLASLAAEHGISASHLQRRFTALLGLSPSEYSAGLRQMQFHALLEEGHGVTEAIIAAGYRSSSRAYARRDGITPSARRSGGQGEDLLALHWPCRFGVPEQSCWLSAGLSARGVVVIQLSDSREAGQQALEARLPKASWQQMETETDGQDGSAHTASRLLHASLGARLLALCEQPETSHALLLELPLDVRGTAFQLRVWQQLNATVSGDTLTYRQLAEALERPTASRAVANACGANPLALLTPCHRVVRGDGGLGGYRWGVPLKQARLAQESGDRRE